MKKIPRNLLKNLENHGNIMEFCQSEKMGILDQSHVIENYCPRPTIK